MRGAPADHGADNARVRSLLADSLALWQVDATVVVPDAPAAAVIVTSDGTLIRVERPGEGSDFRWTVRVEVPGASATAPQPARARPCASLVGMLNAVRRGLGVDVGEPLRIMASGAAR